MINVKCAIPKTGRFIVASIEVIIRDEQGQILSQSVDEDVQLSDLSLRGVETAVETWRQKALPDVAATLLEAAQQRFTGGAKSKLNLRRNGHRRVMIKTLHGAFPFDQQMYQMQGRSVGFIELSNHQEAAYVSRGLQELVAYYSNRLSYEELQGLMVRMTGATVLSHQGSWDLVQQNVQVLSDQRSEEFRPLTETERASVKISFSDEIDLYNKTSDEILLFDDGILVKAQKEKREKPVLEPVDSAHWWLVLRKPESTF